MVESKNVVWDVIDSDPWNVHWFKKLNYLEPIDYTVVDKNKVKAPYTWDHGVAHFLWSMVLTYDKSKFNGSVPETWADLWDVKKYPGKRAFYKYTLAMLEIALLADGVQPDKLYPLDVDRALDKIREIKDHVIFWGSGAEVVSMFLQGEVTMGAVFNSRAYVVHKESKGRVEFTFNQGIVAPSGLIVLKGNPAGRDWAMRWIAEMQDPIRQAKLFECYGVGPANPEAINLIPKELQRFNPSQPENYNRMIQLDTEYYTDALNDMSIRYTDMMSE